jgi:hypothetical protein
MLFRATITSYVVRKLGTDLPIGTVLINTDNIVDMTLSGANDALIWYKFNKDDADETPFCFIVSDTLAEVVAGSNVSVISNILTLPIFEEDDVTDTAVDHYYNLKDLVFGHPYGVGGSGSAIYENNSELYINTKQGRTKHLLCDRRILWIAEKYLDGTTTATTTYNP